jgi:hypothetical protein
MRRREFIAGRIFGNYNYINVLGAVGEALRYNIGTQQVATGCFGLRQAAARSIDSEALGQIVYPWWPLAPLA